MNTENSKYFNYLHSSNKEFMEGFDYRRNFGAVGNLNLFELIYVPLLAHAIRGFTQKERYEVLFLHISLTESDMRLCICY